MRVEPSLNRPAVDTDGALLVQTHEQLILGQGKDLYEWAISLKLTTCNQKHQGEFAQMPKKWLKQQFSKLYVQWPSNAAH